MWADLSEILAQSRPRVREAMVIRQSVVTTDEHETAAAGRVRDRHGLIVMLVSQKGECQSCLEGCVAWQVAGSGGQSDR